MTYQSRYFMQLRAFLRAQKAPVKLQRSACWLECPLNPPLWAQRCRMQTRAVRGAHCKEKVEY
ncbi:MAG: hypothetical protein ACYSW4_02525, partial [Planctomycetota bacterium]